MAIREIVKIGDEILTKTAKEVEINERTLMLLDDLVETLRYSGGLGLAAPQVGMLKRLAVIALENEDIIELINPVIIATKGKIVDAEGCLSVPKKYADVERPKSIVIQTLDRNGNLKKMTLHDMQARAACHEIDHLNGVLFVEKAIRFLDPD